MNEQDKAAFYQWFRKSDCLAISECSETWQAALAHRDAQAAVSKGQYEQTIVNLGNQIVDLCEINEIEKTRGRK